MAILHYVRVDDHGEWARVSDDGSDPVFVGEEFLLDLLASFADEHLGARRGTASLMARPPRTQKSRGAGGASWTQSTGLGIHRNSSRSRLTNASRGPDAEDSPEPRRRLPSRPPPAPAAETPAWLTPLSRAERRLEVRLAALEDRLHETPDEDGLWWTYLETLHLYLAVLAQRGAQAPLITTRELAARFGVTPKTIYNRRSKGLMRPATGGRGTGSGLRWDPAIAYESR